MSLWWLQPGWTDACCARCGQRIYPEGDPDWGMCFQCFSEDMDRQREEEARYYVEMEAAEQQIEEPRP